MTDLRVRDVPEAVDSGVKVEVRSRFDQSWSRGFEVVERTDHGYRIRRLSDGSVLPTEFIEDDVRQEKRDRSPWTY